MLSVGLRRERFRVLAEPDPWSSVVVEEERLAGAERRAGRKMQEAVRLHVGRRRTLTRLPFVNPPFRAAGYFAPYRKAEPDVHERPAHVGSDQVAELVSSRSCVGNEPRRTN